MAYVLRTRRAGTDGRATRRSSTTPSREPGKNARARATTHAAGAARSTARVPFVPRRIVGIDPGSRLAGFGVIDIDGAQVSHVAHGHVTVRGESFAERLCMLHDAISAVVVEHRPTEAAIESVFVRKNVSSALKLGQARGASLVALAGHGLSVAEYAPRSIKQLVTGRGGASKEEVQAMVRACLRLSETLQADAADALAIALCHARTNGSVDLSRAPRRRGRGLRV